LRSATRPRVATARPAALRAQRAHLGPDSQLERWDETAKVEFDRALLNELASLRFIESRHHVAIVGSVGVGKTFLAHALGHVACRRGHSVLALGADQLLKSLKHARLTQTYEKELRALLAGDLLIVDDFGLDAIDAQESRDAHAIIFERHRAGSMIITSNRGPDEWLATFADPMRAQAAIDLHLEHLRPRRRRRDHRGRVVPRAAQARAEGWTEVGEEGEAKRVTPMRAGGGNGSATAGSHPSANRQ